MSAEALFEPRVRFGQGKAAATLLTEDGCFYPIIAHGSYTDRRQLQSAPFRRGWGARPMHATTLVMTKPPWVADYTTTNKQYFGGSKSLNPGRPCPPCPSMHISHYHLGVPHRDDPWHTNYSHDFTSHDLIPAKRLHQPALVNRQEQRSGAKVKAVVKPSEDVPSYWSQYDRIHSKLGYLLGPGVQRDYPVRKQYNFITGTMGEPAWKPDNRRVSGNRILHSARTKVQEQPIIS